MVGNSRRSLRGEFQRITDTKRCVDSLPYSMSFAFASEQSTHCWRVRAQHSRERQRKATPTRGRTVRRDLREQRRPRNHSIHLGQEALAALVTFRFASDTTLANVRCSAMPYSAPGVSAQSGDF